MDMASETNELTRGYRVERWREYAIERIISPGLTDETDLRYGVPR